MRADNTRYSRFLHYALLVASLAAATAGGLVLLGCWGPTQVKDVTVVDPTQKHPEGGVLFSRSDTRESARVNLAPDVNGRPVTWRRGPSQDDTTYGRIPDTSKSNQVEVLRSELSTSVVFYGEYTDEKGNKQEIASIVYIGVEN